MAVFAKAYWRLAACATVAAACSAPPSASEDGGRIDSGIHDAAPAADAFSCEGRDDGELCSDQDACTLVDECLGGVCVGSEPVMCEAPGPCQAGVCDSLTGSCALPDGTDCSDGNICTDSDMCLAGECVGVAIDPPGDLCDDGMCFTDVTVDAGVSVAVSPDSPWGLSASAAFLDIDGDGWLDIAVGSEAMAPRLFRNQADGHFEDVTTMAGIPALTADDYFTGLIAGDIDNDGDPDLYLMFDGPNRLLVNNGSGSFTDETASAGVAGGDRWTTAASFGDYDADGWLDLYVGNFFESISALEAQPNVLFRNLGDGAFEDVTTVAGVAGSGTTLAAVWSDWDGDGDLDLWVCNDFGFLMDPNRLYSNQAGTGFVEVSEAVNADLEINCMGIAPGDYDRDGDLDYYFTHLGANVLLRNDGAMFSDVTAAVGVAVELDACFEGEPATSWGTGFVDFDADGWLDLYVANGHVQNLTGPPASDWANVSDVLLRNDGAASTFTDISYTGGAHYDNRNRAVAFGDYDADGDVDILQVSLEGPQLLRNDSPAPGGSVQIDVRGRLSNRDGLGTRVWLVLPTATLVREIAAQISYVATVERAAHFGIGTEAEASELRLRWPSGVEHSWLHVPSGTRALAVEPLATIDAVSVVSNPVAEGEEAVLEVTLRNETSAPVSIDVAVSLRVADEAPIGGTVSNAVVPAGATTVVSAGVTVPAGVASTAAELVASATDSGGGLDQARAVLTVLP